MNPLSDQAVIKFCNLCNWAYEAWCTHRELFENNDIKDETIGKSKSFTIRLSIITQEYCLQQIAKLHDRAIMNNSINLSIDLIKRFGQWDEEEKDEVESLCNKLNELYVKIKSARNKLIAHNDLETLMQDKPLGEFPDNADLNYFETLQDLVNIVHEKWMGGPYPFNDLAKTDVAEFLEIMKKA